MSTTPTFEGFSLSHAAVLDASGTGSPVPVGAGTGAESQTLYGVRNGTLATDSGNFENTGDDFVLSEWFWFNFANLTIESGFMSFSTLAQVTGQTISSSGTSPNDYYGLPLWVWSSLNQITRPVALRVPARDSQGAVRTQDFILYRVQFMPFNFTGPSYKNGLTVSLAGRALMSLYDEQGNTLPASYPRSLGRIINSPGTQTGAFTPQPFAGI
jgi:hypothetical protein